MGSPPASGTKKEVPKFLSRSNKARAIERTGVAAITKKDVDITLHTNKDMLEYVTPGFLNLTTVTIKLKAPIIEEIPITCKPRIHISIPILGSNTERGA